MANSSDKPSRQPIPWRRITAEGVAIVVSILLAFWIQASWEERQDRLAQEDILEGLSADFTANRLAIEEVLATHMEFDQILSDLDAMSAEELAGVPFEAVQPYMQALTGVRTFESRDATLDGVIASGNLGLIRDSGLREMLVAWKADVEDLTEEAVELRAAGERVLERVAEMGGPWRGDVGGRDGGEISGPLPPQVEARLRFERADLALIGSDRELMGRARAKRFRALGYWVEVEPLLTKADSVLALIEVSRSSRRSDP